MQRFTPDRPFARVAARRAPETPPVHGPRVPASRAVVDCGVYSDGLRLPGHFTFATALTEIRRRNSGFVWLGLHEPDVRQMQSVADAYDLHELLVEDAVNAHQRPKLERYDDLLFLVLRTVEYVDHDDFTADKEIVRTGEVMIILGRDFVITVRHGQHTTLSGVRRELEADAEQLALGPSTVMHAVADHVVDSYLEVIDALEEDIDALEEEIFAPRARVDIEPIYMLKREVLELRHVITPLEKPFAALATVNKDLIPREVRRYFRDVQDHHESANDEIMSFNEQLSSMINAGQAKVAMQQSADMRKISAWVAIAAGPTMLAGVYGMNFDNMPELHTEYGYFAVIGIMISSCILLFVLFRRNQWL